MKTQEVFSVLIYVKGLLLWNTFIMEARSVDPLLFFMWTSLPVKLILAVLAQGNHDLWRRDSCFWCPFSMVCTACVSLISSSQPEHVPISILILMYTSPRGTITLSLEMKCLHVFDLTANLSSIPIKPLSLAPTVIRTERWLMFEPVLSFRAL
jgi:hypothetical protein